MKTEFSQSRFTGGQATVSMPDPFQHNGRAYADRSRHLISVLAIGTYDAWNQLQKVIAVNSSEVTRDHIIFTRFDEISQLRDGWFEETGVAPNADALTLVLEKFVVEYPDNLPLPTIAPKQDGNLLLEWKAEGDPSLDIDLASMQASFHAFDWEGKDVERDFSLNSVGWKALLAFVRENIKSSS